MEACSLTMDRMEPEHLEELILLEESYWWHVAKRSLVVQLLKQHLPPPGLIVEGGIGSGRNLAEYQRLGYDVLGLDIMEEAVEHSRGRGLPVKRHDLSEPWPVAAAPARCVILLDVLEHIADPVTVLRHGGEALCSGGGVLITVPAHPALYGGWDERLGHYRRYTRKELCRQIEAAGLRPVWVQHWNSFSLPAAVMVRLYRRLFPGRDRATFPRVPQWVNGLLLGAARLERCCLRRAACPVGLSLVAVALK